MEWASLIVEVLAALGREIAKALKAGDWSVLDKPVREILPTKLRITLERKRAEAEAAARFVSAKPAEAKRAVKSTLPNWKPAKGRKTAL